MANKKAAPSAKEADIENEVLREEVERLEAENAQLRKSSTKKIGCQFSYEDTDYEFVPKGFNHNGVFVSAEEVRKNLEIQKYLVKEGSGLIRAVASTEAAEDDE